MLPMIRPRLEAAVAGFPGGPQLLQKLFDNVKFALAHGIQVLFISGAVIMGLAVLWNLSLREVPLRGHHSAPPPPME